MSRRFTNFVLSALVLAAAWASVRGPAAAAELRSGDAVRVVGPFPDLIAAAGREVLISASTPDDIVSAGRAVEVDDARADHLLAGAGSLAGKVPSATLTVMGVCALYIAFYDNKKCAYDQAGVSLTQPVSATLLSQHRVR